MRMDPRAGGGDREVFAVLGPRCVCAAPRARVEGDGAELSGVAARGPRPRGLWFCVACGRGFGPELRSAGVGA